MPDSRRELIVSTLTSRKTGPFLWAVSVSAAAYVILIALHALTTLHIYDPTSSIMGIYARVITVLGCIAFAMQMFLAASHIQLNDEFMRSIVFKRICLAAMSTILVVSIWAMLANVGWAPAFDPMYLYLVFIGAQVLFLALVNADNA